jgi:hypothetical protein
MKNNMIDVFNRLTDDQLADCQLFENIISTHYEKFKYFYLIIEDICLNTVQKIHCYEKDTKLDIFIEFKNKKDSGDFQNIITDYLSNWVTPYDDLFSMNIQKEAKKLNISIENKNICREENIY